MPDIQHDLQHAKDAKAAYMQTWRAANRAHIRATNKAWREAHREQRRIYMAAYKAARPEQRRRLQDVYRAKHPERVQAMNKRYHAAVKEERGERLEKIRQRHRVAVKKSRQLNPAPHRAAEKRRRAAKAQATINDFTAAQWSEMQAAYQHRCVYCGKRAKGKLTQDHLTPLAKGGNHTAHNIVPACRSCNSKKHIGQPLSPVQPLLLMPG